MRRNQNSVVLWAALVLPIIWLGALAAQCCGENINLIGWLDGLSAVMQNPFALRWTPYTPRCILGALVLYGLAISAYYSSKGNRRPGEEHGSAKWGDAKQINAVYREHKAPENNIILTSHIRMGLDGRKHRRNLNVLVIGGSGAGKTRFYAKPNLMQCNCSYIVADPKGEIARAVAPLLEKKGYEVVVLDLVNMARSDGYNPFCYLRSDTDALKLVTNLIRNTTPKGASQNDPFWESATRSHTNTIPQRIELCGR